MSDIEIYKKAMIKALEKNNGKDINGWYKGIVEDINESMGIFVTDENLYFTDIFSHSFAKAFWGESIMEDILYYEDTPVEDRSMPEWQYHLQQMVLEEEPLKYLSKFLD